MKDLKEVTERVSVVEEGIKQYFKVILSQTLDITNNVHIPKKETKLYVYDIAKDPKKLPIDGDVILPKYNSSKSVTQRSLRDMQNSTRKKYMSVKEKIKIITNSDKEIPEIEFSDKDKETLRKLELEHEKNIKNRVTNFSCSSTIKINEKECIHTQINFKERPKAKLSVRPKQCVSVKK